MTPPEPIPPIPWSGLLNKDWIAEAWQRNEWVHDRERKVLCSPHGYEIDLETCDTAYKILDWIMQVGLKNGENPHWSDKVRADLIIALDLALGSVQGRFCPFGAPGPDDRRQWERSR